MTQAWSSIHEPEHFKYCGQLQLQYISCISHVPGFNFVYSELLPEKCLLALVSCPFNFVYSELLPKNSKKKDTEI
jgi:hypothetical protein